MTKINARMVVDTDGKTVSEKIGISLKKTPWVGAKEFATVQEALDDPNTKHVVAPPDADLTGINVPMDTSLFSVGKGVLTDTEMRANHHYYGSGDNNQAPAFGFTTVSKVNNSTKDRHAFIDEFNVHHVLGAAPSGSLRADVTSHFHVLSIGDRYNPQAGDGGNVNLVSMGGHYVEHRTDAAITSAFGNESAVSVIGSGSIAAARGGIFTAQLWQANIGGKVGVAGSGSINAAYGVEGNAQILGSTSTGNIVTAIGVQGNAYNQGQGTITDAFAMRSQILNTGTGSITSARNFTIKNTISGGSVGALSAVYIDNTVPTNGATIGTLQGLLIAAQTGGANNRTAWIQGDLHVSLGKRVILSGGASTYDSTVKGAAAAIYSESGFVYMDTSAKAKTAFFGNNGIGTQFKTPASSALAGSLQGEIFVDADYIYVVTANGTLKRVGLTTF